MAVKLFSRRKNRILDLLFGLIDNFVCTQYILCLGRNCIDIGFIVLKALPWFRQLVAGFSLLTSRLSPRAVRTRFLVRNVALKLVFVQALCFSSAGYYSTDAPYSLIRVQANLRTQYQGNWSHPRDLLF
jgi:hypothetical protein